MDLEHTLGASSLGLVEVNDGRVQFIHTSVQEFLTNADLFNASFTPSKTEARLSLSLVCLSYLVYDLPTTLLSWCGETTSNSVPNLGLALQQLDRGRKITGILHPLRRTEEELRSEFIWALESNLPASAASSAFSRSQGLPFKEKAAITCYSTRTNCWRHRVQIPLTPLRC